MIKEPMRSKRGCRHLLGTKSDEPGPEVNERLYCLAFPDGIPDEIAYGNNKHLRPLRGQGNDVVYERQQEEQE